MTARVAFAALAASLVFPLGAFAQARPAPPANLSATDSPWDNGTRVDLHWSLSPDDAALRGYIVRRKGTADVDFSIADIAPRGTDTFTVGNLKRDTGYLFEVAAVAADGSESVPALTATAVSPTMQWFDGTRLWFLVTLVLLSGSVITFIILARRGMPLKLRRIAALDAVDNAIGRATEMGRSCLFVPGVQDINDIQTIAV